jgi:hypothetical protein
MRAVTDSDDRAVAQRDIRRYGRLPRLSQAGFQPIKNGYSARTTERWRVDYSCQTGSSSGGGPWLS